MWVHVFVGDLHLEDRAWLKQILSNENDSDVIQIISVYLFNVGVDVCLHWARNAGWD